MADINTKLLMAGIKGKLGQALRLGSVCNNNISGAITKKNDVVTIGGIADFDLAEYNGNDMTLSSNAPEALELTVDNLYYFNQNIEKYVIGNNMAEYITKLAERGAYKIAEAIEEELAAQYADADITDATDFGTSAVPIDMDTVKVDELLRRFWQYFEDAGVPEQGRFIAVPSFVGKRIREEYATILLNSDPMVESFRIPNLETFDIIVAPKLSTVVEDEWNASGVIVAGVRDLSFAYAEALIDFEFYEPQARFSQAVKGQVLYGAKCFCPEMTGVAYVV